MNTYTVKKNFTVSEPKDSEAVKKTSKGCIRTVKKLTVWSTVALTVYYLLTHPELSPKAVNDALTVSAKALIPSLFPLMTAGELLIASGFPSAVQRKIGNVFEKLFGISGSGTGAFIIGAFCGFPVGARTSVSLYESGEIDKTDAERLSGISNNAGLGFLVSGVGGILWQSTAFGVTLYLSQLFSAVISGMLLFGIADRRKSIPKNKKETAPERDFSLSEAITGAILNALTSMLKVIALTTFFRVFLVAVSDLLINLGASALTLSVINAAFEISSGMTALRTLAMSNHTLLSLSKVLTFAFSSLGGLSVYMQYCAFASPLKLSTSAYIKAKIIQSIFCTLIGIILVSLGAA